MVEDFWYRPNEVSHLVYPPPTDEYVEMQSKGFYITPLVDGLDDPCYSLEGTHVLLTPFIHSNGVLPIGSVKTTRTEAGGHQYFDHAADAPVPLCWSFLKNPTSSFVHKTLPNTLYTPHRQVDVRK